MSIFLIRDRSDGFARLWETDASCRAREAVVAVIPPSTIALRARAFQGGAAGRNREGDTSRGEGPLNVKVW